MRDRPLIFGPLIGPLALFYVMYGTVSAQQTTGIVPLVATDPIAEYLTRGGSFAVILIILFFYRKDWIRLVDERQGQTQILLAALRENSAVMQRLCDKLDDPRPSR